MDDLELLGVTPSDRRKLESMGFTTLEQLSVLRYDELGMGEGKGSAIIQRARNILANRNIIDLRRGYDGSSHVDVEVKEMGDAVIKAVTSVLGVREGDYGNAMVSVSATGNRISLGQNPRFPGKFGEIEENARKWRTILEKRRAQEPTKRLVKEEVISFARGRGFNGFWQNVFSDISGNETMKKALAVAMFSSCAEPVHVLILGEPGSSKTLAKELITQNFRDVTMAGANTTRSGLVCNLATGALGVLAYSDQKLVLIDEFDKIPTSDVEYCYELMSNGRCSVHSARVHEDVESRFIMVAFANPRSQVFGPRPLEDIGLPPLLMSRFALIVRTEELETAERKKLFRRKFYGGGEINEMPECYNEWVRLSRAHNPQIKASAKRIDRFLDRANELFNEYYATPLRRDLRMGDYVRRIPFAIARGSFGDVTDRVIDEAENIMTESIASWG